MGHYLISTVFTSYHLLAFWSSGVQLPFSAIGEDEYNFQYTAPNHASRSRPRIVSPRHLDGRVSPSANGLISAIRTHKWLSNIHNANVSSVSSARPFPFLSPRPNTSPMLYDDDPSLIHPFTPSQSLPQTYPQQQHQDIPKTYVTAPLTVNPVIRRMCLLSTWGLSTSQWRHLQYRQ